MISYCKTTTSRYNTTASPCPRLLYTVLSVLLLVIGADGIRDFGNQPTIIQTDSLPVISDGDVIDSSLMPSVGNGHIATVVYNDTIYMNGIYNGELSDSHRARIPAEINLRVRFGGRRERIFRQYQLDMSKGYWEENVTTEACRVTHRVYAHQFYTRILVTEIFAQRQGAATGNLMIYLDSHKGEGSTDINFTDPSSFNGGNWYSQGSTVESEIPGGHRSTVYTFWSTVPPIIHVPSYQNSIRYTYIMSIDSNEQVAKESFESGSWIADKNPEHFFELHKEAWRKKWEGGGIELSGNPYLEKLACTTFYYLLSSLPSTDSHRQMDQFGGISSGGLAHGGREDRNRGLVSWDQERWISPAILPFYPSLAKSLLGYRTNTMLAAKMQAEAKGYNGLLYAWKSAATGADVTPLYEPRNHYHLNGDISLAIRQYMAMTGDRMWMQQKGACQMVKDIALFYYTKIKWNSKTKHFDLRDVSTIDGTRGSIDNSVYTNTVASLAMHYTKYAACLCNIDVNTYAPQEWIHAAQSLHWEYNTTSQYNPVYEGYQKKGGVKQVGPVMLNYPLMWNVDKLDVRNNIQVYAASLPNSTPATAWAMLAINLLEMGDEATAQNMFKKSYEPYVSGPYKTWVEYPNGGGSNYLSGMAGYLQVLLYGYGGLRIHLEYLYMNPRLPKDVHSMTFRDINYLGSSFDIRVTSVLIHVSVLSIGIQPLRLVTETGKTFFMNRDASIPIQRGAFTIKSKSPTGCPLPDDNIVPYSPETTPKYTPAAHTGLGNRANSLLQLNLTLYLCIWLSLS